MNLEKFRALSAHHRALVTLAVLLDGPEAEHYLGNDSLSGEQLAVVAREIASLQPDFRILLAGHHLRTALEDIHGRISPDQRGDSEESKTIELSSKRIVRSTKKQEHSE